MTQTQWEKEKEEKKKKKEGGRRRKRRRGAGGGGGIHYEILKELAKIKNELQHHSNYLIASYCYFCQWSVE
jgi:hypothetical protein